MEGGGEAQRRVVNGVVVHDHVATVTASHFDDSTTYSGPVTTATVVEDSLMMSSKLQKSHEHQFNHSTSASHTTHVGWRAIGSFCFAILAQILFGTFDLVRSLVAGHVLRWMAQPQQHQQHPHSAERVTSSVLVALGKTEDTWPPPAFFALAGLTILALVVHPDGYTWVLLRKIRDAIITGIRSSSTFWEFLLNDYGAIVSSLLAVCTFACLFFLAYVLHKTLAPRGQCHAPKQKKKKRKGPSTKTPKTRTKSTRKTNPKTDEEHERTSEEKSTTFSNPLPALLEDEPISPPVADTSLEAIPDEASTAECQEDQVDSSRLIYTSVSTVDSVSTMLSEDQSCDSASGRSTPTPIAACDNVACLESKSKRAANRPKAPKPKLISTTNSRKQSSRRPKPVKATIVEPTEKQQQQHTAHAPQVTPSTPSRWDALKPQRHGPKRTTANVPVKGKATHSPSHPPAHPHAHRGHAPKAVPSGRTDRTILVSDQQENVDNSFFSPPRVQSEQPPPSPAAVSLSSCEDGASTWSTMPALSHEMSQLRSQDIFSATIAPRIDLPHQTTTHDLRELQAPSFSYGNTSHNVQDSWVNAPYHGYTPLSIRPPPGLLSYSTQQPQQQQEHNPSAFLQTREDNFPYLMNLYQSNSAPKENPFEERTTTTTTTSPTTATILDEDQIEAELQELGGQMVGSILDF